MGIHETDVCFINLHTYTDTAFVALHFVYMRDTQKKSFQLKVTFRLYIEQTFSLLAFQIDFSEISVYMSFMENNDDTIKLSAPVPTVCVEYLIFLSNS